MDTGARDRTSRELQSFAAAVVHELRTPLCALSGEVEIALRRERPAAAYREALARISCRVADLVALTGDLALLGQPCDPWAHATKRGGLDTVLASVVERYERMNVTVRRDVDEVDVCGDVRLLARALTLLVEHAVRHRLEDARVTLGVRLCPARPVPDARGAADRGLAGIVLDVGAPGCAAGTWEYIADGDVALAGTHAAGLLRLHTAVRIVDECGGSIHVTGHDECQAVTVWLRRA